MRHIITITLLLSTPLFAHSYHATEILDQFKNFLEHGTFENGWPADVHQPLSRYHTFKQAFEHFEEHHGKVVVELGTTRSYVHGGHPDCMTDNVKSWTPNEPKNWDWGAGGFTRVAALCLGHLNPEIHTIDISGQHINRAKIMTQEFSDIMHYHVCSSEHFLRTCNFPNGIDLLYLDTGGMDEWTARLHLAEAKIIVERDLMSENGIILIDDVGSQAMKQLYNEQSKLGKAKYSLPYFLDHGYEVIANEYQVIIKKRK